jgi:hypothetical protein
MSGGNYCSNHHQKEGRRNGEFYDGRAAFRVSDFVAHG